MAETLIGLDGWLKAMERLPLTLQRKLIAKALREGAEPIEERIRDKAPDDPDTPGSQIAENIGTNVTEQTADGAVAFAGPTKAGFMAGFLEWGTAHQTSRPFIGPAFDETVDEAVDIIGKVIGDGIDDEWSKR